MPHLSLSFQEVTHTIPCPHTSHGCLYTIVCRLCSQQARPYLPWTSDYWEFFLLLDLLLWIFSCPLLSFFYLCHFSFSLNLYVVITISSPVYFTSFSCLSLPSEEEMATHSNILAWKIPWTEEPSGLQCTESQRAGRDFATKPPSPPPFCVYFLPYLRTHSAHIYIIPQFPLKTYSPLKWPYQIPSHLWAQLHLSVVPLTLFHLERKSLLICYCVRQCVNQ